MYAETVEVDSAIPLEVSEEFLEDITTELYTTTQSPTVISSNDKIYVVVIATSVGVLVLTALLLLVIF